jgi:hypothetical protein
VRKILGVILKPAVGRFSVSVEKRMAPCSYIMPDQEHGSKSKWGQLAKFLSPRNANTISSSTDSGGFLGQ